MAAPEKGKHEELLSLSDYAKKLEHQVREQYLDKILVIEIDAVLIPGKNLDPECLPPVKAADLLCTCTGYQLLHTTR